ncbi:predicted protein [Nematostella vectensis]|uniref:Tetraspanin n=1 Tax=Nematostella vectensis TaxID=45351 RepID=A7SPQ7_NEMVE|nr:tetraspanin-3 [Nematostella vectensis]EDO34309.1 predicted protein [Nematostella vectensis]|eukprot:XP_001626409.1 predicted protein [Nematostella vectensis]
MSCAKAFLFFFNFIYLGISAALIYVAVWLMQSYGNYSKITSDTYTIVPAGIIVGVGCLVLVTALVGICGTCRESKCCLSIFFILLLVVFSLEITAGVLGAIYKNQAKDEVKNGLTDAIDHYSKEEQGFQKAVDKLQENLDCCGSTGPNDWVNSTFWKEKHHLPKSCCTHDSDVCFPYDKFHNTKGCYTTLLDKFNKNLSYIIGIGIGFAVLQLIGMLSACCVMCSTGEVAYLRLDGGTRV